MYLLSGRDYECSRPLSINYVPTLWERLRMLLFPLYKVCALWERLRMFLSPLYKVCTLWERLRSPTADRCLAQEYYLAIYTFITSVLPGSVIGYSLIGEMAAYVNIDVLYIHKI